MMRLWVTRTWWVIMVVGAMACCSSPPPAPVAPPQAVRAQPPPPQVVRAQPPPPPVSQRPAAKSACQSLYAHYQHETARIPYPANLPIRTLLPVAGAIVKRYAPLGRDAECIFMVRSVLARFFVHSIGPGIVPPPAQPISVKSRP